MTSRSINVWVLRDSRLARNWLCFILAVIISIWQLPMLMAPSITAITSTNNIYLPPNVQIVANVENKFAEWRSMGFGGAGAGGIAILQITRELTDYQQRDKESSQHFLVIQNQENRNRELSRQVDICLSYFGKNDQSTHVNFTQRIVESPPANFWSYYFPNSWRIDNGKLITDRMFKFFDYAWIMMFFFGGIIWANLATLNYWLSRYLQRAYKRNLSP